MRRVAQKGVSHPVWGRRTIHTWTWVIYLLDRWWQRAFQGSPMNQLFAVVKVAGLKD